MNVLIVEPKAALGALWAAHLTRQGAKVAVVTTERQALAHLIAQPVSVVILNLLLPDGSAFAVADFASYRHPTAKVIFVSNTTFFSDGSIFQHIPNACAFVEEGTRPEDLAAMVEYHGD